MVTFGGAYAVLAYVAQQAAEYYHWVTPREMLDGLGMAETTPGPLIMVVQFVGFMAAFREVSGLSPMLAGTLGGLLATWVTFAPCFLWIFVGAPYIEALRGNKALAGALSAITAAVVGVILNLSIWFALHTIFRQTFAVHEFVLSFDAPMLTSIDWPALALSVAAATAIFRFKAGMLVVLAASCITGVLLRLGASSRGSTRKDFTLGWDMTRRTNMRTPTIYRVATLLVVMAGLSPAHALTQEELVAKIQAAGYSQVSDMKSTAEGTTAKAVKNGREVRLVLDSSGQIKEQKD
jgi:chromate transport protein ChrA